MNKTDLPIAFTMGDPSGIGPEVVIKTFLNIKNYFKCVIVGDPLVFREMVDLLNCDLKINTINNIKEALYKPDTIDIFISSNLKKVPKFSVLHAENGKVAFKSIIKSIELVKDNLISGIVTAPINKEAFHLAGIKYPGHTEILTDYNSNKNVAMMLVNKEIKTVLVTLHCSLLDAIKQINLDKELYAIKLAHKGAVMLGIKKPVIAVAALNPHAGEGGLFGSEEKKIILPAIKLAKKLGIDVSGPFPSDTVYLNARLGKYDIVVSQYHDQGLIPIKYFGLENGVNITVGLEFLRTSPDHGTAFDIAGKGIANSASFQLAVDYIKILKKNTFNQ